MYKDIARRIALALALLGVVGVFAACNFGNSADPIVEPGPPALEPKLLEAQAESPFLKASEPLGSVDVQVFFEDLDIAELGTVPLLGKVRVQYLSGGTQTLEIPLPQGLLAEGSGPGPFEVQLTTFEILALEVSPGQSLDDHLQSAGADEFAVAFDVFARDSALAATNTASTDKPRPQLDALSVGGSAPGQMVQSVLQGFNLGEATAVEVEGEGVAATIVQTIDESSLQVFFNVQSSATSGERDVRVFSPGGVSALSSSARFDVAAASTGPVFVSQSLLPAQEGSLYQASLVVTGGTAPLSFQVITGSLPAGVSLAAATGEILGTPTEAGNFSFTMRVTDDAALSDQIPLELEVKPIPIDGRDALSQTCDPWADAVTAQAFSFLTERATGATDTVNATLETPLSLAVAGRAASLADPLTLVSELDGSYVVFDLGPIACEQVVAVSGRAVDLRIFDPDGYADAVYVWLSNDPTELTRLVRQDAPNTGTFTAQPLGIDAGSDGERFRYVIVASVDANIPNLDSIEIIPFDPDAPETAITLAEVTNSSGVPTPNGDYIHVLVSGDDTQGGENPLGTISEFLYQIDGGSILSVSAELDGTAEILEPIGSDGLHSISIRAVDGAANQDPTADTADLTIDTTPPEVADLQTGGASVYRAPTGGTALVPVSVEVTDAGLGVGQVNVVVSGAGNPTPVPLTAGTPPLFTGNFTQNGAGGAFVLQIQAIDAAGNQNTDVSTVVTINVNAAPTVTASGTATIAEGTLHTLNAIASDPESDPFTLGWSQVSGPQVLLTGAETSQPYFLAPLVPTGTSEIIVLEAAAQDDWNGIGTDTVEVTITNVNTPPVANAGKDKFASSGALVSLDGSASSDPDQDLLAASWAVVGSTPGAPAITLQNAGTFTPSFTAPILGPGDEWTYTLRLTVSDAGDVDTDDVLVTVTATEQDPIANAGPDRMVLDGNGLSISGTNSYDPDGTIASYQWTLLVGNPSHMVPAFGSNASRFQATLNITSFQAGADETFTFQLEVTDNNGGPTGTDTVTVSVRKLCSQAFSLVDTIQNAGEAQLFAADPATNLVHVLAPDAGQLVRVDASIGDQVSFFNLPGLSGASDLSFDEATGNLAWINPATRVLTVLRTHAGDSNGTAILPSGAPSKILAASNGEYYALDPASSGTLFVLSSTPALRGTVDLGFTDASGAGLLYTGGLVWVLSPSDEEIVRVNPATPAISDVLPLSLAGAPMAIEVATSGEILVTHDRGFALLDSTGAVLDDFVLEAGGGFTFDVLAEEIGGFFYATNDVPAGGPTTEQKLYRVERSSGTVLSLSLGSFTGSAVPEVRGRIARESGTNALAILQGLSAGQSRLLLASLASWPPAPVAVDVAGGEGLDVQAMDGQGVLYALQRGRTLTRAGADPLAPSADHIRLGFASSDLLVDAATGDVLVAGASSQELKVVGIGDPITVTSVDAHDPAAMLLPDGAGGIFALNAPRATFPEASLSVGHYDGAQVDPVGDAASLGATTVRVDLAHDPVDGVLYISNPDSNGVRVINAGTGAFLRGISLGFAPTSLLFDPSGPYLWAAGFAEGKLSRVEVDNGDLTRTIAAFTGPSQMILNPVSGLLYIRCETADRVLAVDRAEAAVRHIIDAGPLTDDLFGIAQSRSRTILADAATGEVLVLSANRLAVIDPSAGHSVSFSPFLGFLLQQALAYDPVRRLAFSVDGSTNVRVVDLSQGLAAFRLPLPTSPVDSLYSHVDIDPAAGRVYVTGTHSLSIFYLDPCGSLPGVQYGLLDEAGKPRWRYARKGSLENETKNALCRVPEKFVGEGRASRKALPRKGSAAEALPLEEARAGRPGLPQGNRPPPPAPVLKQENGKKGA
ncbi:MAG: putative Ig domain-containing protein [Bdellovibrionota bacterium]